MWAPSRAAEFDRILARRDGVDAPVEAVFRARAQLDPRLLVISAVGLDPAGAQCIDDHRRRLVEPAAALVHRAAERGKFAPRQAAAKPEPQPAVAKKVEHRRLLGHAQRVVPGQDHRGGAEIDVRAHAGEVGHQLQIVGAERIVEEMVLGRPQHIEAKARRLTRQAQILVPDLIVAIFSQP